jgi:hypothetical protein
MQGCAISIWLVVSVKRASLVEYVYIATFIDFEPLPALSVFKHEK